MLSGPPSIVLNYMVQNHEPNTTAIPTKSASHWYQIQPLSHALPQGGHHILMQTPEATHFLSCSCQEEDTCTDQPSRADRREDEPPNTYLGSAQAWR